MRSNEAVPATGRQHHLDWIRVSAFGLLILYHVGMFYVPWDWHVKSRHAGSGIEPLMYLTQPWRLTLLFLISGVATRFLFDKSRLPALVGSRIVRLLLPLAFGMAMIVPPQAYYEVVEKLGYADGYLAFYQLYLSAYQGFCREDCLILPTWNHLWFVAYLLIYSIVLLALAGLVRAHLPRIEALAVASLSGWRVLVVPMAYLVLTRLWLLPRFEITHALVDDWYNHALSFAAFAIGFLAFRSPEITRACTRHRWTALALAAGAWALWTAYAWQYRADDAVPPQWLIAAMRCVYAVDQWSAIVAIFGFAARHLNRDSAALRYLNRGVFTYYIAHQTIIVVAGHHLTFLGLAAGPEAAILIVVTILGCAASFELARRMGPLGIIMGANDRRAVARHRPTAPVGARPAVEPS
jgi:hypothetical protein